MDLHPPIASRTTEELLKMSSDAGTWQPEAQALARMELGRRGVAVKEVEEREQEFKEVSLARHELRERHAQESYSLWQLIGIFLVAPFLILGKLLSNRLRWLGLQVKLGLTELDRRNYNRKYRQRMAALIVGALFWLFLLNAFVRG